MTSSEYKNTIQWTLSTQTIENEKDILATSKHILGNLGVPFPQGSLNDAIKILDSADYMGWNACSAGQARYCANNGYAAIGISSETIVIILPDEDTVNVMSAVPDVPHPIARTMSQISAEEIASLKFYTYAALLKPEVSVNEEPAVMMAAAPANTTCNTGCQVGCQYCDTCQTTCQVYCQTCNSCQTTCESVCQDGCQTSCQTSCQVACQTCDTCQSCDICDSCDICQNYNTCESSEASTQQISVTAVHINDDLSRTTLTMREGEEMDISCVVLPDNATNKSVSWTPAPEVNPYAMVVSTGSNSAKITAIAEGGPVAITVKSDENSYKFDYFNVLVKPRDRIDMPVNINQRYFDELAGKCPGVCAMNISCYYRNIDFPTGGSELTSKVQTEVSEMLNAGMFNGNGYFLWTVPGVLFNNAYKDASVDEDILYEKAVESINNGQPMMIHYYDTETYSIMSSKSHWVIPVAYDDKNPSINYLTVYDPTTDNTTSAVNTEWSLERSRSYNMSDISKFYYGYVTTSKGLIINLSNVLLLSQMLKGICDSFIQLVLSTKSIDAP